MDVRGHVNGMSVEKLFEILLKGVDELQVIIITSKTHEEHLRASARE